MFCKALAERGLEICVWENLPIPAERAAIEHLRTHACLDEVIERSRVGVVCVDVGDTPAFVGDCAATSCVVGSSLDEVDRMTGSRYSQRGLSAPHALRVFRMLL